MRACVLPACVFPFTLTCRLCCCGHHRAISFLRRLSPAPILKDELIDKGIVKAAGVGGGLAAGNASVAEALAAQMVRDSLSRAVGRRPSVADMADLNWMRRWVRQRLR